MSMFFGELQLVRFRMADIWPLDSRFPQVGTKLVHLTRESFKLDCSFLWQYDASEDWTVVRSFYNLMQTFQRERKGWNVLMF